MSCSLNDLDKFASLLTMGTNDNDINSLTNVIGTNFINSVCNGDPESNISGNSVVTTSVPSTTSTSEPTSTSTSTTNISENNNETNNETNNIKNVVNNWVYNNPNKIFYIIIIMD